MKFSGKDHTDTEPSTRPGIESGTFGLEGRDLTTAPHPPLTGPSLIGSLIGSYHKALL